MRANLGRSVSASVMGVDHTEDEDGWEANEGYGEVDSSEDWEDEF